jgi:hypothetical protein
VLRNSPRYTLRQWLLAVGDARARLVGRDRAFGASPAADSRAHAASVAARAAGARAAAAAVFAGALLLTTSDSGRVTSLGGASGVVRSIYANRRPVMVLEAESSNDSTIIWLMDELGEQSPEVSESVGI